uniref:Uncharacterized protein n=1 Tax=Glossina brevipalpis TaxID=37001 RepID=A0A1A9W3D9_9MUSC
MATVKIELGNGECNKIANCNKINQVESNHEYKQERIEDSSELNNKNEEKPNTSHKTRSISKAKRKRPGLNQYHKQTLLQHMINNGCDAENLLSVISNFKVPKEEILKQLNISVKEAEDHVYQQCDSLSFQNINAWLEYLKKINAPKHCHYESGVMLNAIANNENHPSPAELNGIDLKSIYTFLSNAFFGLPQPQLDSTSCAFLIEEFESLINEANTEQGDKDTCDLRDELQTSLSTINPDDLMSSLNPLNLHSDIGKL